MSNFITNAELRIEAERLIDENDKLRKLVQRLYAFALDEYPDGTEQNFADELYELEIEV